MKRAIHLLVIVIFFFSSLHQLFAQTIVGSGREAVKGEVNFTELANYLAAHPEPLITREPDNDEDNDTRPAHAPVPASDVRYRTTSSYLPDHPAPPLTLPVSNSPVDTFESTLDNGTLIPPDTHGAVDLNYCVTAINSVVHIQTRAGVNVSSVSLNAFWSSIVPGGGTYDPRVHYDPYTNRWILVTDVNAEATTSSLLIAVSKTSDPTGAWWMYEVTADASGVSWLDYPTVGFNKKWITISGNMFAVSDNSYTGAKVFAFDKAGILAGTGATYTSFVKTTSFTICPTLTYDTVVGSMFLVESWDGTASGGGVMRLWKITGAVGSESMTSVGYPASSGFNWQGESNAVSGSPGADFVPQSGTSNLIQANDDRITQVVFMNNKLWFAHNVFVPYSTTVNPKRCSAQWWQIDTSGTPTQIGLIDDTSSSNPNFYFFPTITPNIIDDAIIGFSVSSSLMHPSAGYALRLHTDPVDSTRQPFVFRHGQNAYFKNFGSSRDRWGDYSGAALDPINQTDFWTIQEASASTVNKWDTWWAYVKPCVPPVSTVTAAGPTTFCNPGSVTLNANTGSGLTYQWQVGGSPITGATTSSYTATTAGDYTVVVYQSTFCDSVSLPVTVTVNMPPTSVVTPAGSTTFCAPGSVILNANTGSGLTYQWQVGGSAITGATTSSYTATTGGNYAVIVTHSGCDSTSLPVTVADNAPPASFITPAGPTTFCAPGSVVLNANTGSGLTYQWQAGGSAISGATTSSYTATTGGNYKVTVTQSGLCDSTSLPVTVTVVSAPPATITPASATTFCAPGSVVLNANTGSGLTYQWQVGSGAIAGATTSSYAAAASGSYTVVVTQSGLCSTASSPVAVTVIAIPTATITPAGPTTFCTGGNVVLNANTGAGLTYQWQAAGSPITGATTSSYTASTGGNYTVVVTQSGLCSNTSSPVTVTVVSMPPATITPAGATTFCAPGNVVLNANTGPGLTYQWQNGSGTISGATTSSYNASATGSYTVVVTQSGLCNSVSSPVAVTVVPIPPAFITPAGPVTFCFPGSVLLNANTGAGLTYQWQVGGSPITGATTSSYTASANGNYTVLVTQSGLCDSVSLPITVVVDTIPAAAITPGGPTTFCVGSNVALDATPGAYTYQWQTGGSNIPGATSSSYTAATAGNYSVIVAQNICIDTSSALTVTVNSVSVLPITGATGICIGQTVSLSDATSSGIWTSGNPTVATVDAAGNVTGLSTGSAIISYSFTNVCGTAVATTTVMASPGITVAPIIGLPMSCIGGSTPLSDAMAGGVWSTTNTAIATIDASGVVSGVSASPVTISYSITNAFGCLSAAAETFTITTLAAATITPAGPLVICPGGAAILSSTTGSYYTYQWQNSSGDITGAITPIYTAAIAGNYNVVITLPGGCTVTSAPVAVSVGSGTTVAPSISIIPSAGPVLCVSSSPVTFVATSVNGGTSPVYQWHVNGSAVATGPSYTYSPANGDNVSCMLTSNASCAFPDTASAGITMTISPLLTPSVSITASPAILCSGSIDTFSAMAVNGGSSPAYLWNKNGASVTSGHQYIYAPVNGDQLFVTMTSNFPCLVTPVAVSDTFVADVQSQIPNTLTVSVAHTTIIAGQPDTFTAVAPNGGATPSYQWLLFGTPIPGATNATYITSSLNNYDVISCAVTSSEACATPATVTSGGIMVTVLPEGVQQVSGNGNSFSLIPNPNRGSFTITGTTGNNGDDKVTILITDILGQTVYTATSVVHNGILHESVVLDPTLANGTYLVNITSAKAHVVLHAILEK